MIRHVAQIHCISTPFITKTTTLSLSPNKHAKTKKPMASPTLITPSTSTPKPRITPIRSKLISNAVSLPSTTAFRRRELLSLAAGILSPSFLLPATSALAASDEEYVREASEVIQKVRSTLNMDKGDPKIADSVAELREASNYWVAKYRREKALLGRASFRDIYSALNAVSGHYVSFGPTTPIPAKRKMRILEEMDTAEKALQRGR